jgi:hypothetical protein
MRAPFSAYKTENYSGSIPNTSCRAAADRADKTTSAVTDHGRQKAQNVLINRHLKALQQQEARKQAKTILPSYKKFADKDKNSSNPLQKITTIFCLVCVGFDSSIFNILLPPSWFHIDHATTISCIHAPPPH